jgi:putative two-component system response regulator
MRQILVVDDAAVNLRVYERILAQLPDVTPVTFTSSQLALDWTEQNEPDLVIVDYQMPAPDGLEVIRTLRERGLSDVPIVMITSMKDREIRLRALELGADDFALKPADPVEFLVRARNLLKLRDRTQRLADRAKQLAVEVRAATNQIECREIETIHRLTRAAEHRDRDTRNHIVRMGHFARLTAKALGMSQADQELMFLAAPMHDIGKVAIPDRILLKNGRLSPIEWQVMMGHARAGYDILAGSDSALIRLGAEIALSHHEKFDGSGYPNALHGKGIPLSGRICAVSDVFDALLSTRPYKPAWRLPAVIDALKRGSGNHFDPDVVDGFLASLPEIERVRREFADMEAA